MKTRMSCLVLAVSLLALAAGALPALAQDEAAKDRLKARFEARNAAVLELKSAGLAGETSDGLLELIDPTKLSEAQRASAAAVIVPENADRTELYGLLAAETNTSADVVARQTAMLKFKKAGPDEWFKAKDSVWRQKKDMLKATR